MYRPVVRPCAHASSAATRAAVPLPFVPVTWIDGYVSCGSSSSVASARIARQVGHHAALRAVPRARRRLPGSSTRSAAELGELGHDLVVLLRELGLLLPLRRHDVVGRLRQEPFVRELGRSTAPASARSRRAASRAGPSPPRCRSSPGGSGRTRPWASARSQPGGLSDRGRRCANARDRPRGAGCAPASDSHAGSRPTRGRPPRLELHGLRRDAVLASGTGARRVTSSCDERERALGAGVTVVRIAASGHGATQIDSARPRTAARSPPSRTA